MVRSAGVEPTLSAPEANVLSTGLRAQDTIYIITENKLFVEQFFIVLLLSAALSCLLM